MSDHDNIPPSDSELIDRFLLKQMLPEERQAFLERLKNEAELRQTTDEMELVILGIKEAAIEKKLTEFHRQIPVGIKTVNIASRNSKWRKAWLAAAAVLIFVSGLALWLLVKPGKVEELYATYYKPDPGLPTVMSNSDNYTFDRAMIDYKTGQYAKAIKVWDSLLLLHPQSDTLNYFLGSAWMAMQQPNNAIPFLERVSTNPISQFKSEAYWYLALAWLKDGNSEKAVHALEQAEHPQKEALLLKLKQ